MAASPWWRGRRREWFVVVQFCLFALVAIGPPTWNGWPRWPFAEGLVGGVVGGLLMGAGGLLAVCGAVGLGSRICAVPYPPEDAVLRCNGPFRIVRHPMYCGAILAALGWAIVKQGWLTVAYAAALFMLFDVKARREEQWLTTKFAEYPEYQKRVRKLIPFVY